MIGKIKRLNRLYNRESGNIIIVPLDHGFTLGPIKGLDNMDNTIKKLVKSGADSLLLHKGMIMHHYKPLDDKNIGLIMHLSASTCIGMDPSYKVTTGSIYDALVMGCDAVSVHINFGSKMEPDMIRDVSFISSECIKYGMPLIIMAYPRGNKISNEYDKDSIKHAARIGAELGADIIKVNYTGDRASFTEVVESCPVPVVIAGGEKINDDRHLIRMIYEAMRSGAKGISIGRNIFQHERVDALLKVISMIVHKSETLESAWSMYQELLNDMPLVVGH